MPSAAKRSGSAGGGGGGGGAGGGGGGGSGANTAQQDLARNNFVCFVAWGLPAFQTAAVIVMRLVDADELLGKCGQALYASPSWF